MNRRVHFMGAGGVGMAGVAFLLKRAGFSVSGCDCSSSQRTDWLAANGVPISVGHSPAHLDGVDELVATPAVPRDAPELAEARRRNLVVRWRGEVLADLVNARDSVAVCGSHGKTTTSTFAAKLLRALGDDPAWCIGGETGDFPVAGAGAGPLVVEADESDGTLALYRARTLVVTNVDYDHPEHFKTEAAYRACYDQAIAQAADVIRAWELDASDFPELPSLVAGRHNVANARAAIEVALRRGHSRESIRAALPEVLSALPDRRFQKIYPPQECSIHPSVRVFECSECSSASSHSSTFPRFHSSTPALEHSNTQTLEHFSTFPPFHSSTPTLQHSNTQTLEHSISIYTDYAHHPREIACALEMARAKNPRRLRVLFQPHRYTRTAALLRDFPPALAAADELILIPVYAAFEQPIPNGDVADLYSACREFFAAREPRAASHESRPANCEPSSSASAAEDKRTANLALARNAREAWRHAFLTREPGDLILLLGAGDLISLVPEITATLSGSCSPRVCADTQATSHEPRTTILGAGSNTWRSDLTTDEIYRRTDGPANALGASLGVPWMAGIPGTIGGWTAMNAGAFGHSIGELIESVTVRRADGSFATLPAADCGFGYRTSSIDGEIYDVKFRAAALARARSEGVAADYLARRKKFPAGTKGSVFKNPPNDFAGRLLEAADAKSLRVGGAYVWGEHANVIVAGDGATASDFLALARLMARAAFFKFGVRLEPEVRGLEIW